MKRKALGSYIIKVKFHEVLHFWKQKLFLHRRYGLTSSCTEPYDAKHLGLVYHLKRSVKSGTANQMLRNKLQYNKEEQILLGQNSDLEDFKINHCSFKHSSCGFLQNRFTKFKKIVWFHKLRISKQENANNTDETFKFYLKP